MNSRLSALTIATLTATLVGCGGGSGSGSNNDAANTDTTATDISVPTTYTFTNSAGDSTVSYSGQTARHVLIDDLKGSIATVAGEDSDKKALLDYYFRFDDAADNNDSGTVDIEDAFDKTVSDKELVQRTFGDISTGKNLIGKIAGEDSEDHIISGDFFGMYDTTISTPVELVDKFFDDLIVSAKNSYSIEVDGESQPVRIEKAFINVDGLDYQQLIQKFLLGAVTFSQGTADYLQTDFGSDGNLALKEGKNYTNGEHKWDEAFGYFGATRNYNNFTDDEIAAKGGREGYQGFNDIDGDKKLDLKSEVIFGNSSNCAKRDRDADGKTDFTKEAFDAFLAGRAILDEAAKSGELTAARKTELDEQVEIASVTWEKCIAATVIHYINDVRSDMGDFVTKDGSLVYASVDNYTDLAKHWGEMKGFALGLQFNPISPFRASPEATANLKEVLSLMRDKPVLVGAGQAEVDTYRANLEKARDLLRDAYGFDAVVAANW